MNTKNVWSGFFLDQNVRFPTLPKLISGISIYDAPYGLGIQFRGGPKKLIIKGKSSSEVVIPQMIPLSQAYECRWLSPFLEQYPKETLNIYPHPFA